MSPYIRIGVISSSHGIKGEAKIYPTTDDVRRFSDLSACYLENKGEMIRLDITHVKYVKGMPVVQFSQFASIDDVMKFKNHDIYIPREEAVELDEDEYYIADLIDLRVVSDTGEELGILTDVMETGSNDVYIVTTEKGKELLIPAIRDCILGIDFETNTMTIHVMPGLLD